MQFYRSVAPSLKWLRDKFHSAILTGSPELGRQTWAVCGNKLFSSFMHRYLENGKRYVQSYYERLIVSCMRFRLEPRSMTLDDLQLDGERPFPIFKLA